MYPGMSNTIDLTGLSIIGSIVLQKNTNINLLRLAIKEDKSYSHSFKYINYKNNC